MKSFTIAWKDLHIRLKDRKGFLMMILMPLILTAILGTALSGVMGGEEKLPLTIVGVVVQDQDELATTFVDDVLKSKDMQEFIKVRTVPSEKKAKDWLKKEKIDAGVVIPVKWSGHLKDGQLKDLTLLTDPGKSLQASIVESITTSFTDKVVTMAVSSKVVMEQLASSTPVLTGKLDMRKAAAEIAGQLQEQMKAATNSVSETPIGKRSVSSSQYYAAAMAAMFLLYNITTGAKSLLNERATETLARLLSTPTGRMQIVFGKFLGTFYFAVIQFTIFTLTTHFAFQVDWGKNLMQVAVIGLVYSFTVAGLSMLIAALIREEKTADVIGGIGIQIFAILGGSMLPLSVFPDLMQKAANITPNKWVLTSFINIMSGTTWNTLLLPVTVLLTIGIISLSIGTVKFKLR